MPAEPSVAISAVVKCDQSNITLTNVGYKRNISAVTVVDNSNVQLTGVAFKRNLQCKIKVDSSNTHMILSVKRCIQTCIRIGQSLATIITSIKRAISANLILGDSESTLIPAFKRSIQSYLHTGQSLVTMKTGVKHSVSGTITTDSSDVSLTKLSRKILYPPPTADIFVMTAEEEQPLQGAKLNIGDTYGWNIYLKGYHLDAIKENNGSYLLLTVKKNLSDPDSSVLFQKASKQPISGIAFKGQIRNIQATGIGTIQYAELQARIYPFDTNQQLKSDTTLYAELELIDPLGEIVTILRKSFTMVTGVRYGTI